MGALLSILLLACLGLTWHEPAKPARFVALMLATLAAMGWFFYTDITQPLSLSF